MDYLDTEREHERAGESLAEQVQSAVPAQDSASKTILIAENDINNRKLIEHILDNAHYRSVSASNGFEVLTILDRQRVDVILLDMAMPLLDGYQTARQIRQRPDGAFVPIVAVTGNVLNSAREQAFQSGCTDYLPKPFRADELLDVVRRMLLLQ